MVVPWFSDSTALGDTGLRDYRSLHLLDLLGFARIPLSTEPACDEPYMHHGRKFKADKESQLRGR